MIKRLIQAFAIMFLVCTHATADTNNIVKQDSKIIWNTTEEFFQNDINRFFCLAFGASGCAVISSYGTNEQVYKQILDMSKSELRVYTKSNGDSFSFVGVGVNSVQTQIIASVGIMILFSVIFYLLSKGTGTNIDSDSKRKTLIINTINASVIFLITSATIIASKYEKPNVVIFGFLYPVGMINSIAEGAYHKRFDRMRFYFDPITVPDLEGKSLEMTPVLDFVLCVSSSGGADVKFNFEKVTDTILRANTVYKTCSLSVDIGYDSEAALIQNKYKLNMPEIKEKQTIELKAAFDQLISDAKNVVYKTIEAYESGNSSRTITTTGTSANPATVPDSYIYYSEAPKRLSRSFIARISDVNSTDALIGGQAELCSATERSGGRAFFRPKDATTQMAQCVEEACAKSLYACTAALYFQKEMTILVAYRAKGIYSYPTVFLKGEISSVTAPENYAANFNANFDLIRDSENLSSTNLGESVFSSSIRIDQKSQFDYEKFRKFQNDVTDEYRKYFDAPDYDITKLFESEFGFLGIKKLITCVDSKNAYRIAEGYSCGSVFKEMQDFSKSITGFVLQINLAIRNNKIINKFTSKYLDPTKSLQKKLVLNAVQVIGTNAAVIAALNTEATNSVYSTIKSDYLINNNALASLAITLAVSEQVQDRILVKINKIGKTIAMFGYSFAFTESFLMTLALTFVLASIVAFAYLFPLLIIILAKLSTANEKDALSTIIDFIVEKSLTLMTMAFSLIFLNVVITIITRVIRLKDVLFYFEITDDVNSVVGFFKLIISIVVIIFFIIYFIITNSSEAGKAIRRTENAMAGDFEYNVSNDERQVMSNTKEIKQIT